MVTKRRMRRGLATIEAALVVPIVLLLTFGVIEYGWLFMRLQQINGAARYGARIGARADATAGDANAAAVSYLNDAGLSGASVTVTPNDFSSLAPGDPIRVEVEIAGADAAILNLNILLPIPGSLRAEVVMAKEGPDS